MSEVVNIKENRENRFDSHDLTPFEHLMLGSSTNIVVNGKTEFLNSESFKALRKDQDALRVILIPMNMTEGRKTLEEIQEARATKKEMFSPALHLFESEPQFAYIQKNINFAFKLGEVDKNGQVKTFEVFYAKDRQKINLPEKALEEIIVRKGFEDLIKYVGNKDNALKYKINTGKTD